MAGLKLKLRPEEQILINGAVIQNGTRQVELTVKTAGTRILRLRDAIHPNDANTPVKRVCYIAQLAVAGEVSDADALSDFTKGVKALQKVFTDTGSQETMDNALEYAKTYDFYKAMQSMRKLITYEEALFAKFGFISDMIPSNKETNSVLESLATLKVRLLSNEKHDWS
jgi:flagellar biosynthesis repressor protein FlbT